METIFVFTHTVMTICLIGILYMSVRTEHDEELELENSAVSKVKSLQITTATFYRMAAGYLAAFIK